MPMLSRIIWLVRGSLLTLVLHCGAGLGAGVRGLYKGLLPDMAKIAPASAISWTVFERAKASLGAED